nr:hypothetical protein [Tanacetum cinerariifolium]
ASQRLDIQEVELKIQEQTQMLLFLLHQQIAASLEDKLDIRMNRFEKSLNDMKNSFVTPTARINVVEESNTIPNPKGEAKAIMTRSGMTYKETPILPAGVEEQEPTEETTDTELPSTEDIQPPLVQVQEDKPIEEPSVVIPKAKDNLPYPSRLAKEKIRKKDDIVATKFMEIFRDLHFELSFADALVHMPKFAPMFKKFLNNKNKLIELTKTPLNKNCSVVVLKKLLEKLELADRTILKPTGAAENVFVKVGKFYFPADLVVLDFITDPRVLLILGIPFLSTAHTIINVHEREIIIRQDQQSLIIQCGDIPSIKKVEQINKIDFIDAGGIDFDSEEIENFLNDDSIPFGVEDSPFNMEEDILFLESLLREDPIPSHPIISNQTKSPMEEPKHSFKMEYEHFNTNLVTKEVAESSTKNLVPISHEGKVTSENRSESIEPVNVNSSVFMTISNPLFNNDKINSDELNLHVESNSDESISNHDTVKFDNLDEFSRPFIPIHILEEERIRREHADYINRMEIDPHREEIDIITDNVLPPSVENDDSDKEVDAVDDLRVDNSNSNSEHEYSESEDSDFDNPLMQSTKIQFRSIFVVSHIITLQRLLSVLIILEDPDLSFQQVVSELRKFEQCQFQMQQYLQHEHYALWEVIEFGDSYEAPENNPSTTTTSTTTTITTSGDKSGRTVTLTTEDTQKKNDVKARTTLLLSLPDEHQLRFNDMEEMDIKWNMALLSMRADKFWKKTGKKISIQGSDVAGFDKSKVECFNCHKMGHFARECRASRNQERGRRDTYRQGSKAEEQTPKALMAIDGVG